MAPETEAVSAEKTDSTEQTGSHGETSPSHEYWYPWESETDDGATGPGKATRPYETESSPYPGETYPGWETRPGETVRPGEESRPGGETSAPGESQSIPGYRPTESPQESSSGVIIIPEGGESQSGIQKPGTGPSDTPGGPGGQVPGQYTDTGVILNPGSADSRQPGW